MKTIQELHAGYRRFRNGKYQRDADLYETLSKGQDPNILLIGCADSRADPGDIFDAAPGQLFVIRNVANLVPPFDPSDGLHGVSAALEFAVTALKVQHIVIMGHGGCGGVAASLAAAEDKPVGKFIAPWVELLNGARDRVLATDTEDTQLALEREGISASLDNLKTFPFVTDAIAAGNLDLHGAWFAIAKGELHWRNGDTGVFDTVVV